MGEVTRTDALSRLRRMIGVRFAALVPLAGLVAYAADRGAVVSPSALILLILAASFANGLLFLLARRSVEHPAFGEALLFTSLVVDVVCLLGLLKLSGGVATPLTSFLLLPTLASAVVLSERNAVALSAVAVVLLFAVAAIEPATREVWTPWVVAFAMAALMAGMVTGTLLYRRRGRFFEHRVELLESERLSQIEKEQARNGAVQRQAARRAKPSRMSSSNGRSGGRSGSQAAAAVNALLANTHSPVEAVADALATDLREPTGVVRARAEALRYELAERGQLVDFLPELTRLLRAADRLDDVRLTLSVLSGGNAAPRSVTDVADVACEVRDVLESAFTRDSVRLELEAPSRLPEVAASHNEVRLVMVRLLDAARSAAVAAGRPALIVTSVQRDRNAVVLEVADTLPLPRGAEESDLFDPMWSPPERPALGLALSVTRIIVERRGGEMLVQQSSGGGLSVQVVLRIATTARKRVKRPATKASPTGRGLETSRDGRALARGWGALTRRANSG